ncbi:hypothetical protein [Bacillus pumilus]|uniref:hypothetical protein n=1 Tax=Bacillus pumilus TaxID=1408 RepID=UPI0011A811AA|nr:hypothetical protein [Bacillus pumilus]
MTEKTFEELLEKIKDLGWSVNKEDEGSYNLGKFSPRGQDFNIKVMGVDKEKFIEDIYGAYLEYDVSFEAYLWLDETGHGKNGAPYEMKDVLSDMESCAQMILDLYNELSQQ